jgi:hypothetical protein
MGATTIMRPRARPSYSSRLPAPLPSPATSAQTKSIAPGLPRLVVASAAVTKTAMPWLVAAMIHTLVRRVATPPTKSDRPYVIAEARDNNRTTPASPFLSRRRLGDRYAELPLQRHSTIGKRPT